MEQVVLVDSRDREIGLMDKMEAHKKGLLHRAFSVILFNNKGQLLLQKRAAHKYHSGGLWSNTCCSHPRHKENLHIAAIRRLKEEIGIEANISFLYSFIYKYEFHNDLIEHELDHVFIGETEAQPYLNPDEVEDFKWVDWMELTTDIHVNEQKYSFWFKIIIDHLLTNPLLLPEKLRPKIISS